MTESENLRGEPKQIEYKFLKIGPDGKYYATQEGLEAAIKAWREMFTREDPFHQEMSTKEDPFHQEMSSLPIINIIRDKTIIPRDVIIIKENPYTKIIPPDVISPEELREATDRLVGLNNRQLEALQSLLLILIQKKENPPSAVVSDTPNQEA